MDNCIATLIWGVGLLFCVAFWWPLLSYSFHYWVD